MLDTVELNRSCRPTYVSFRCAVNSTLTATFQVPGPCLPGGQKAARPPAAKPQHKRRQSCQTPSSMKKGSVAALA